jgi:hypothetical protein
MSADNNAALSVALSVSVPLAIADLMRQGGPSASDVGHASSLGAVLAEKGDRLLYRSEVPGETARLFNALVFCLAVLSFTDGGIVFAGQRWQAVMSTSASSGLPSSLPSS